MKAIAEKLEVDWTIIKDIIRRYLLKKYKRPIYTNIIYIAIDEISYKRGHRYLTIVLNLLTGQVIYVAEGKGADALDKFWEDIGPRRAKKIKAVAMDLGKAYQAAVREHVPKTTIVFDHYHVTALLNKKLDAVRRSIYDKATKEGKKVLKGLRWILVTNNEDLGDNSTQRKKLEEALEVNKALSIAYYLKEESRLIWTLKTKEEARIVLLRFS
jgi:transposase